MIAFKKLIFFSLSFVLTIVGWITFAAEWWTDDEDFVIQAFKIATEEDRVIWRQLGWNSKEWMWNWILWWITVVGWSDKEALIVAVARFLVRFTLVIAITMVIYNWIMFVVKSSKGELAKDSLKNIVYIALWVLLALMSVVIIRLANSVGTTTLDMGKSDKISYNNSSTFYI